MADVIRLGKYAGQIHTCFRYDSHNFFVNPDSHNEYLNLQIMTFCFLLTYIQFNFSEKTFRVYGKCCLNGGEIIEIPSFRPFGGGDREYTHSISIGKLEARIFLLSNFKGPYSHDQQKTIKCLLITSKVTLTGQSHFMLIFVLRKVTLHNYTNSVHS